VPRATVGSLLVAGALYSGLHAACVYALPDLGAHQLPLSDAARVYGQEPLYRLVQAGMIVSALGIAIGMMAMTPRYLAALGHDGALGRRLGEMSARNVPVRAFAATWGIVVFIVVSATFFGSLSELFALSSVSVLLQYVVTALSLVELARKRRFGLRLRDAWPAPLCLIACVLITFGAKPAEMAWVALILALGFGLRAMRRGPRPEGAANELRP
jgi:amino acid transporter